jgi:hypothetical protein
MDWNQMGALSNLASAAIALVAAMIAMIAAVLARSQARAAVRAAEAAEDNAAATKAGVVATRNAVESNLLAQSLQEYNGLYEHLKATGDFQRANADLSRVLNSLTVDNFQHIFGSIGESDQKHLVDIWGVNVRNIKSYFKKPYKQYENGSLSEDALKLMAERAGIDLLLNTVLPLEKFIFFNIRKNKYTLSEEDKFRKEFADEIAWYADIKRICTSPYLKK